MAPVLRAILSVGALSADAATGSIVGPVGRSEIQEAAQAFAQGDALGRENLETRPETVGALADGCAAWLHGGSRMSGDVHVRFYERLGVKSPGPTHLIVHCRTEGEANLVRVKVAARLKECGLELHPEKTKLVYCTWIMHTISVSSAGARRLMLAAVE